MPIAAAFKVLVVDDQLTMREVTKLALNEIGVRQVLDAENGKSAFQVATTQPLDMIISDFNMPEMDVWRSTATTPWPISPMPRRNWGAANSSCGMPA